jgi:hypothetical protein
VRVLGRLSILALSGDELPTEFQIFAKGWNDTEHGKFLFDAQAASSVLAAYVKHGVDRMIDLEHLSLNEKAPNYDPDARGWAKLEVRPDGSLWAVGVTWTPDGAQRLSEKRQRYISPTFLFDRKSKQISKLWNIAITAQPATHHTRPLVAAAAREGTMTIEELGSVAEALGLAPDAAVEDILASIGAMAKTIADAANGGGDIPPDEQAVEEPALEMAAEEPPPEEPAPEEDPKKKDPAVMAASAKLMRLSGKPTMGEAFSEIEAWRKSHLELETERLSIAKEKATLESAERRRLCASLVTLGAEFPATVWVNDKASVLKPRWAKMELAELRAHVSEQTQARGGKSLSGGPKPPVKAESKGREVAGVFLSDDEIVSCSAKATANGVKPEEALERYAAIKQRQSGSVPQAEA